MRSQPKRQRAILAVLFVVGLGMPPAAYADEDIRGVITARGNDGTFTVRTDDGFSVIVVLDDDSSVERSDGLRDMTISSAWLVPGLRVHVEGEFLGTNRFVADDVEFSRSDLKIALAIKAGTDTINERSLENEKRIAANDKIIAQQQHALQQQELQIATNKVHLRANDDKIGRAGLAIEAANYRFASLADHEVKSTMTVYFKNGSASIGKKQKEELEQLAEQAKEIRGFVIQIEGHASAVGSDALNQQLSMLRAFAVAAVLSQSGIPPTHMLVPATMGASAQVAANTTSKGQSENRRVVVTLLQNKGITGTSAANPGNTIVERVSR